jgi:benzylsuccinate CoA-transferase BbsF subunit
MTDQIFAGVKVADFSWAAAGPIVTKQFGDNGATVIKIESIKHPDSVRLGGPFKDGKPGINRSGFFADFNSSKLSVAVDLNHPRALEVIRPLIAWADVVADSFRPQMMARWGLGYEQLRAINPGIIMFSSSLYGAEGPWSSHPGFGAQGQAIAGFHGMTGWADRPPAVPKGAYTDSTSPRFGMTALMAALIHREKTGQGQHILISQVDAGVTMLSPELLGMQLTGKEVERNGNADERALLHAVLPCSGDDRWIAIEIWTDEQWRAALSVLTGDAPTDAILRASPEVRSQDREKVEDAFAKLTSRRNAFELMEELRAAGVPAGVALRASDLLQDKTLRQRGHFVPLEHPEMGVLDYNGPAYRFEATPSRLTKAAPCLGEDTDHVLRDVLALEKNQIDQWREAGVLV